MITEFIVSAGERVKRLDAFLVSRERKVSRSSLQRLIRAGRIRVNTAVVKPNQKIKPGDRISMDSPEAGPLLLNNKPIPLDILFEDESLLVVNKPAGAVVHPTSGHWNGTLLNGLIEHLQSKDSREGHHCAKSQPGLVHRLDKETSGVMVVAKTDHAHRALCSQFEKHSITRIYEALVYGRPIEDQGTIESAIGRDVFDEKKVSANTRKPQTAVTEFRVLQSYGNLVSWVELTPRTGKQHQLRVHMATLGCPILGDQVYGGKKVSQIKDASIPRIMLHARYLGFQHPLSNLFQEYMVLLPPDMQAILQRLQQERLSAGK